MIAETAAPVGFISITTALPKHGSVPLGRILRGLSDRLAAEAPGTIESTLESFLDEHERYANALKLATLSCPRALKAWAAERLPALGIPYGYSNKIAETGVKEILDDEASLRLLEFADDLALIAAYGRKVKELTIDASPHSHGFCFRFLFSGASKSEACSAIEDASIQALLNQGAKDNSLRRRIICTERGIEVECIALRKKVRLGLSPLL